MKITVRLDNGQESSQVCNLPRVVIGRSAKCDFTVPDESLSRQHCAVEFVNGEFFITDLGSSNGVFIEGEKIEPNTRTPFSTFFLLTLGNIECVIQDADDKELSVSRLTRFSYINLKPVEMETDQPDVDNEVDSRKPINLILAEASFKINLELAPTKPVRKVNNRALNTPPIPNVRHKDRSKSERTNTGVSLSALAFFGILLYFGYEIYTKKPKSLEIKNRFEELLAKNTPAEFKTIKNEFPAPSEYGIKDTLLSCHDEIDVCVEFGLTSANGEGVVLENFQYYVAIVPSLRRDLSENKYFRNLPDQDQLIAIHAMLKSQLFERFLNKEFAQIHLIVKNESQNIDRVYRFHVQNYVLGGNEKLNLLSALSEGVSKADMAVFWTTSKRLIPFIEM